MRFHGDELSTEHGSSYNAFLIRDKEDRVDGYGVATL